MCGGGGTHTNQPFTGRLVAKGVKEKERDGVSRDVCLRMSVWRRASGVCVVKKAETYNPPTWWIN